jgi:hypothetical protein
MTFKKMNAIWARPPIAGLGDPCPNGCMSSERDRITGPSPHVCGGCRLPLVQPERVVAERSSWRVYLRCPNCRWTAEELLDEEALKLFDEELERGTLELVVTMHQVTEENMREYVWRFVSALYAGAIGPADF